MIQLSENQIVLHHNYQCVVLFYLLLQWGRFLQLKALHYDNNENTETKLFTKSVKSQKYLNFSSNYPISHKKGVVSSRTDRAINLAQLKNHPNQSINQSLKMNLGRKNIHVIFLNRLAKQNSSL